jgi:hypothetical protein
MPLQAREKIRSFRCPNTKTLEKSRMRAPRAVTQTMKSGVAPWTTGKYEGPANMTHSILDFWAATDLRNGPLKAKKRPRGQLGAKKSEPPPLEP